MALHMVPPGARQDSDPLKKHKLPFRLLDLPPELRSRIYAFAVRNEFPPCFLSELLPPPLALVSVQVWREALPVFFAENTFAVSLRSNLMSYCDIQASTPLRSASTALAKEALNERRLYEIGRACGIIGLSKQTEAWIKEAGPAVATFRNLDLNVYCGHAPGPSRAIMLNVSIRMSMPAAAAVEVTMRETMTGQLDANGQRGLADIKIAVRRAVDEAKSRKEFKGFALEEVVAIARAFICWPEHWVGVMRELRSRSHYNARGIESSETGKYKRYQAQ